MGCLSSKDTVTGGSPPPATTAVDQPHTAASNTNHFSSQITRGGGGNPADHVSPFMEPGASADDDGCSDSSRGVAASPREFEASGLIVFTASNAVSGSQGPANSTPHSNYAVTAASASTVAPLSPSTPRRRLTEATLATHTAEENRRLHDARARGGPRIRGSPRSWYELMADWYDGLDDARRERERTGDPGHPPDFVARFTSSS